MGKKNRFRWAMYGLTLAAIVIFLLARMPRTHEIDVVLQAVQIPRNNPEATSPVSLTVRGTYRTHWFSPDTFQGDIILDSHDITRGNLWEVTFDSDYGTLSYQSNSTLHFLGYVKMNDAADDIIICLFQETPHGSLRWSPTDGIVVTYPARTLDDIRDQLYPGN